MVEREERFKHVRNERPRLGLWYAHVNDLFNPQGNALERGPLRAAQP